MVRFRTIPRSSGRGRRSAIRRRLPRRSRLSPTSRVCRRAFEGISSGARAVTRPRQSSPAIQPCPRRATRSSATATTALDGAAAAARALGYFVHVCPTPIVGEARDASISFVRDARRLASEAGAAPNQKCCILAAGETTVTVTGDGSGGRNQEFALAGAREVISFGRPAVLASAGTDGIDGPTDAAGGLVDSTTLERARRVGLDWESTLSASRRVSFPRAPWAICSFGARPEPTLAMCSYCWWPDL